MSFFSRRKNKTSSKDLEAVSDSIRHLAESGGYDKPCFDKEVPSIFSWSKSLTGDVFVHLSFSCGPAEPPFDYRIEPGVHVFSKCVGRAFHALGFDATWGKSVQGNPTQVFSFLPAHLRWQDDLSVERNILLANLDDLHPFSKDFQFVDEKYISPILGRIQSSSDLAELILWGQTTVSRREDVIRPRYSMAQPFVFSGLLFLEDNRKDKALEAVDAGLAYYSGGGHPVASFSAASIGRLEKIKAECLMS